MEEEGAYIRLLSHCWLHGSIPSDESLAVKLLGKGGFNLVITNVLSMFQPGPIPGQLVHERLEAERRKQADWREKSSAGGKKSAQKRWPKHADHKQLDIGSLQNGGNHSVTLQSADCSLLSASDTGKEPLKITELVASLSGRPAYQGIDVPREADKCLLWCEKNRKKFSVRRLITWLNRVDPPITGTQVQARLGANL
jgi:uncharacterized protein YdaU (DUF1376 family)